MPIDRAPWTALVDDDGSNLVGTIWNKDKIKTVLLDPIDAKSVMPLRYGPPLVASPAAVENNYRPALGDTTVVWILNPAAPTSITGIQAEPDGTQHLLINITGSAVTLQNQHAGSSVGNRIVGPGYGNYTLNVWSAVWILYTVPAVGGWLVLETILMAQKLYVEKTQRIMGEQFFDAADPPAVGVHRCGLSPMVETGPPHVHGPHGEVWFLHDTDWIVASQFQPTIPTGVLIDAEFQALYGAGPPTE